MKAILLKDFGGVENLQEEEVEAPKAGVDEVLLRVKSISINPVDLKIRQGVKLVGRERDQLPLILGWDVAGIVVEAGPEAAGFKPGDEVFGMLNYPKNAHAYAHLVVARPEQLALKPSNISFEAAAAATLSALTAWQALTVHGTVKRGNRVLIHAASGGVGHFAVQMAKYLGAYVIGTSSELNRAFVLSIGADEHIDYRTSDVEQTAGEVDFVLDPIGGDSAARSLGILKKGGMGVSIVFGFTEMLQQKAKKAGISVYNAQVRPNGEHMAEIADLLEEGVIKSTVFNTFPFGKMAEAHLLLESGRSVGKIVLTLS